jgi:hypothetical protein
VRRSHLDGVAIGEMPAQRAYEMGQLDGRVRHNALRHDLALARRIQDVRGEGRHLRRRRRGGPADQVIERLQSQRHQHALQQRGRFLQAIVRLGGRGERAPADPIATPLVAQLPPVAAGAVQPAVLGARVRDRPGAGVDQNARLVAESGCQRDLDVAPDGDTLGHARRCDRGRERLLLGDAAGTRRSDERDVRGELNLRVCRCAPSDIEDDRGRPLRAAGLHRGTGAFRPGEDAALPVAHHDGGVGAAAVDTQ